MSTFQMWKRAEYRLLPVSNLLREAVLERELQPIVIEAEAIGEVLSAPVLELGAHHHIRCRRPEQIGGGILTLMECSRCLGIAVRNVGHRPPHGAGDAWIPVVIDVGDGAEDWECLSKQRAAPVGEIFLDANVN